MGISVSRTNKSLKNMIYGMAGLLINLVITFVAKSFFIKYLGDAFNGINGLFSNILSVLSLAELGFAGAIAYALYKPLSEGDELTTSAIMNYFAKVYRIIALIVLVAGSACIPILQYLIKEPISELPFTLNELRAYFAMFLASTVLSYLLAYKRTIITADQNAYIVSNVDNTANILLNILQIVLLVVTKNYFAFLGVMLAKTIINNVIIHVIASKKYKYLNKYRKERISKELSKSILKNVKAMLMHRIGTVAIVSTVSIVISAFVSNRDAGLYGNYILITTNVGMLINIIFSSLTASIGNLCVNADTDEQIKLYKKIEYLSYFLGMFTFTCFVVLFNDFIALWIGAEKQFSIMVVIAISFQNYVNYMRKAVLAFRDAKGLFYVDRYKALVEAALGIALSIGLSYVWGVFGVIVGYTIATLCIALPVETYVLYKHGFNKPMTPHFIKLGIVAVATGAVCALTYWLASYIILGGVGGFVLKLLLAITLPTILYLGATCRTEEFKYYLNLFKRLSLKLFSKIKNIAKKEVIEPIDEQSVIENIEDDEQIVIDNTKNDNQEIIDNSDKDKLENQDNNKEQS